MYIEKCVTKKATLFVKVTSAPEDIVALSFLTRAEVAPTENAGTFKLTFDGEDTLFAEVGDYAVLFADDVLICDSGYFEEHFQAV